MVFKEAAVHQVVGYLASGTWWLGMVNVAWHSVSCTPSSWVEYRHNFNKICPEAWDEPIGVCESPTLAMCLHWRMGKEIARPFILGEAPQYALKSDEKTYLPFAPSIM